MATTSDDQGRGHGPSTPLAVVRRGDTVVSEGTAVRVRDRLVLVPDDHWTDGPLTVDGPRTVDLSTADLALGVPLLGVPLLAAAGTVSHGASVTVTGTWDGAGVEVRQVVPRPPAPAAGTPTSAPPHSWPPRRPPGAPGPPTALEEGLLADGTLTARMPYGDGTLHVVADDVELATRLLTPLYGGALRVRRAVYSQAPRRVARAALDATDEIVTVCAVGSGPLDDTHPAEQVHTLGVMWVTAEIAEVLAPVAEGLVRVESHVRLADPQDGR